MKKYNKIKICSKCKQEKSLDEFYKKKNGYYRSICKFCHNKINTEYKRKNPEKTRKSTKRYHKENPEKVWAAKTLYYHKHKNFIIKISKNDLLQILKNAKFCPYCNIELTYSNGFKSNMASLDRINNEKILTMKNIQIICWQCNTTKGTRTHKKFIHFCKMIAKRF